MLGRNEPRPATASRSPLARIQSKSGAGFTVGRDYADRFQGLIDGLEAAGYKIDGSQSGGYNPRNIRGTNTPSQHAFGRAIDINWTDNPRGKPGNIDPQLAQDLASRFGLEWGGAWKNVDPMHFQIARDGPVPMAERGLTSFAGLGPAPQPEPELPPMLSGFSNLPSAQYLAKQKMPGEPDLPPILTGSLPESNAAPMPAHQPSGLWGAFMNPMTQAGLAILGSPTRDVGQGLQVGNQAQEMLLRRLDPNRDLERRYKEAQIAATQARTRYYDQGGANRTGQTERIIERLLESNPDLSYEEAVALARRAPQDDSMRLENLAMNAYRNDPSRELEEWRSFYGLSPRGATPSTPAAAPPPPPVPGAPPPGGQSPGATSAPHRGPGAQEALARARQAIQNGAPRDVVIQRLRDAGIDPAGL